MFLCDILIMEGGLEVKNISIKLIICGFIILIAFVSGICACIGYNRGFSNKCKDNVCQNSGESESDKDLKETFDFDESVIVKDKTIISELYSIIGIEEKNKNIQNTIDCSLNYYLTQYYFKNADDNYLESLIIELFGDNHNYFETPSDSVLLSKDCEESDRCKFISFNNAKNIMEKYSFLKQEKKYFKSSNLVKNGYLFIETNYPYANLLTTTHNTIVVKDASIDKELIKLIDNQTRYDGDKIVNKWQFHYIFSKNNNGDYVLDSYYIEY